MSLPGPTATLWLPRRSLGSCLRAYVGRSTLGAALVPSQRRNHFPATPLCGLTWILEGDVRRVPWGSGPAADGEPLARVTFSGPHNAPSMSVNTGEVRCFMLLLMPDAFQALTGQPAGHWLNRWAPAAEVFDEAWQPLFDAVLQAGSDAERRAAIEAFVEPRWAALRQDGPVVLRTYRDWTHALAAQAATSGLGRSVRQVERRIKAWAGLSLRELRGLARAEQGFLQAMAGHRDGSLDWAAVAEASGYADQSHFCRETRRVTGFSPAELYLRLQHDESFWIYRIWS